MSIPKIIHQCWIGPHKKPKELMRTWRDTYKDWEYMEWDEDRIENFKMVNRRLYQEYLDGKTNQWNGAANVLRYEILYKYGGFWADADSRCIKKIENYFLKNDCFCTYVNERLAGKRIGNAFIGACKNNGLMSLLISELSKLKTIKGGESWKITGPAFITGVVKRKKYTKLRIYPSYYFMAKHYTGREHPDLHHIYANHLWGTTFLHKGEDSYNGKDFGK